MNAIWEKVAGLDLKAVRRKFAAKKNWWWHLLHEPGRVEMEYRQFLFLSALHADKTIIPWSASVDEFWHEHILDTARYAVDCNAIAGRVIEHTTDLAGAQAFGETRKLYVDTFGREARRRRHAGGEVDFGADVPHAFQESSTTHHAIHHVAAHHGHSIWGTSADGGHGGHGGHSCGGHGGHGCGGHGCGGHGCGGHGCGGH
jgi:hypothetical protein